MRLRKHVETELDTEDIFSKVSKCKHEELEGLLKHIESIIEKSDDDARDLLMAKTMVTSRLASMRSK
jgi:hypothetical protein